MNGADDSIVTSASRSQQPLSALLNQCTIAWPVPENETPHALDIAHFLHALDSDPGCAWMLPLCAPHLYQAAAPEWVDKPLVFVTNVFPAARSGRDGESSFSTTACQGGVSRAAFIVARDIASFGGVCLDHDEMEPFKQIFTHVPAEDDEGAPQVETTSEGMRVTVHQRPTRLWTHVSTPASAGHILYDAGRAVESHALPHRHLGRAYNARRPQSRGAATDEPRHSRVLGVREVLDACGVLVEARVLLHKSEAAQGGETPSARVVYLEYLWQDLVHYLFEVAAAHDPLVSTPDPSDAFIDGLFAPLVATLLRMEDAWMNGAKPLLPRTSCYMPRTRLPVLRQLQLLFTSVFHVVNTTTQVVRYHAPYTAPQLMFNGSPAARRIIFDLTLRRAALLRSRDGEDSPSGDNKEVEYGCEHDRVILVSTRDRAAASPLIWLSLARWPWFRSVMASGMQEASTHKIELDASHDMMELIACGVRSSYTIRVLQSQDPALYEECLSFLPAAGLDGTRMFTLVAESSGDDASTDEVALDDLTQSANRHDGNRLINAVPPAPQPNHVMNAAAPAAGAAPATKPSMSKVLVCVAMTVVWTVIFVAGAVSAGGE